MVSLIYEGKGSADRYLNISRITAHKLDLFRRLAQFILDDSKGGIVRRFQLQPPCVRRAPIGEAPQTMTKYYESI